MMKKPRSDSKLKTLPEERQSAIAEYAREHPLPEVVAWLRADGLQTSTAAVSQFLSWWQLRQQLSRNELTVSQVLADLQAKNANLSQEQLDSAGQMFFSALAIEQQDSLGWKRVQDAKTRRELVKLAREKWVQESCNKILAAATDDRTRQIAEMQVPNAEKIKLLRQHWFADVDELEASGEVKLPPLPKKDRK